ncbi:MAG: asparagine synthase (glutamine-hydrolyzing) [Flavobacteriales bacterium]
MCGILGQVVLTNRVDENSFQRMLNTLEHRGPDGQGIWISDNQRVAFGHRRLSFFDLTENGKQPMHSNDGYLHLTYNGEIYNFQALKKELEAEYSFHSNCDSEVILAAYRQWGISCISKFEGMFSFALFDEQLNELFLVRDRFGIKPLYYAHQNNQFLFASELKAIVECADVEKRLNYGAMMDFFVYRYIPSPKTIWQDMYKVPPAHYLKVNLSDFSTSLVEYWTIQVGDESVGKEAFAEAYKLELKKSVDAHVLADVPIGSFLSGGYDSSTLAIMGKDIDQAHEWQTFTVGFENWEKSEDQFAELLCQQHQIENKKVSLNKTSLDDLDLMPNVYDEPIADISIIPTYAVSKLARQYRKAVLSGEGADELFLGYHWQKEWIMESSISWKFWQTKKKLVPFYSQAMSMGNFDRLELKQLFQPNLHDYIPENVHWFYDAHAKEHWPKEKAIQYLDMKCFMGELVLTKIDRASMANSLEVRVPFLTHQAFEKVFQHRKSDYFDLEKPKYPIYSFLKNSVSMDLLARKKQGFVGPDDYYMDVSFYKEALKNSYLISDGIISREYIDQQLSETYNWRLWKIVVFEKWYAHWRKYISK